MLTREDARATLRKRLKDIFRRAVLTFINEGQARGYSVEFCDAQAERFARVCALLDGELPERDVDRLLEPVMTEFVELAFPK